MAIVGLLVVAIVGTGALHTEGYSAYPTHACRWYEVSRVLRDEDVGGIPSEPTPEAAIASFANEAGNPWPVDGWRGYRGRWVHDLPDGTYAEVRVIETEQGWIAYGHQTCRH